MECKPIYTNTNKHLSTEPDNCDANDTASTDGLVQKEAETMLSELDCWVSTTDSINVMVLIKWCHEKKNSS